MEVPEQIVGVVGAGTMGRGMAQLAATYGNKVLIYEKESEIVQQARHHLEKILARLVEKGKFSSQRSQEILGNIEFVETIEALQPCHLVMEAVIENLVVKQKIFKQLEGLVEQTTILASNTSSLSIAAIGSVLEKPERFLGIHFFNPAPVMPLVEIIPGIATDPNTTGRARQIIDEWHKVTVVAKDTPGFIVNRVARPFYGESLRILEEGWADEATIDWALKEIGGFRMGPFELMDFIGNDVNFEVTLSVFESFFYEPRFRPSLTQKRMVEAGRLGRKSGIGYYDYREGASPPTPNQDRELGQEIFFRVLVMLINEAADAVFKKIASVEDVDLAMTKGVNYPKGLLKWADEIGIDKVLAKLEDLHQEYGEERYRPHPLVRRMAAKGVCFHR